MRNIYKWWVKKNPVKILNTVYTIVIQQSEIVKNQAQLQKYLAVCNFMYTLVIVITLSHTIQSSLRMDGVSRHGILGHLGVECTSDGTTIP